MNSPSEKRDHGDNRSYRRPPSRRLSIDSHKTESRYYTNNMPLMPVNAASITAAKTVAHGAVPNRIKCSCTA